MKPTNTHYDSAGKSIQVELYDPSGAEVNRGVVIVVHEADGMVKPWAEMISSYAEELADKGFVTLIPNYFGNASKVDFLRLSTYQAVLADAVAYAKTLGRINPQRIGLLGFSLGGHLCLRNRAQAKVLVEFFAPFNFPILPALGDIGTVGNPGLLAQIHHGLADGLVPFPEHADPINDQLKKDGAEVTLFSYKNAGHGFTGADSGDDEAQRESKKETIAFFEKNL